MPRVPGCDAVYEVADQWRDRCLSHEGSLFWPSEPGWDLESISKTKPLIRYRTDSEPREFTELLRQRFSMQPNEVRRIAADLLGIWPIMIGWIKLDTRIGWITAVNSEAIDPSMMDLYREAVESKMGGIDGGNHPTRSASQLEFYLRFVEALKREEISPWDAEGCHRLAYQIVPEIPYSNQSPNMLLHILFPDAFEAITLESQKRKILRSFGSKPETPERLDSQLRSIREQVARELGHEEFTYFDEDVRTLWDDVTPDQNGTSTQYWWVNQGKSYQIERDGGYIFAPGTDKTGLLLPHHQILNKMQLGDQIIHYHQGAVRAIGEVTGPIDPDKDRDLRIGVNYSELSSPVPLTDFPRSLITPSRGPFDRTGGIKQQYAFRLDDSFAHEFLRTFGHLLPSSAPAAESPSMPSLRDLSRLSHWSPEILEEIESLLREKKQIIFEGPPGSGKTYLARLFARYLAGVPLDTDVDEHVEIVQFHQSYGYEDFVAGIRPITSETGQLTYQNQPGLFVEMCRRAEGKPDETFVLIIDEINRGNLSRIFGELLYGLEYRGQPVRMQYPDLLGDDASDHLTIPDNLYLIGTMNSTDRSLAMIDYALRRRFYFWRLMPTENGDAPVLRRWLEQRDGLSHLRQVHLLAAFVELNRRVAEELGEDYQIGHSYFMLPDGVDLHDDGSIRRIWRHALEPLLYEYFHASSGAEKRIADLERIFFPTTLPVDGAAPESLSSDDV